MKKNNSIMNELLIILIVWNIIGPFFSFSSLTLGVGWITALILTIILLAMNFISAGSSKGSFNDKDRYKDFLASSLTQCSLPISKEEIIKYAATESGIKELFFIYCKYYKEYYKEVEILGESKVKLGEYVLSHPDYNSMAKEIKKQFWYLNRTFNNWSLGWEGHSFNGLYPPYNYPVNEWFMEYCRKEYEDAG